MRSLSFKKLSIQKKLIITIMGISSIMLLSTLSIFITSELISLKKTMLEDLSTLADLVGKNSYGALMFYDKKAADENLVALKAKPHIMSAHLFKDTDQTFSQYHRDDHMHADEIKHNLPDKILTLIKNKGEGHFYINDHIHVLKPIIFEADQSLIGFIHIQSDQEVYWQRVTQYVYTIIFIVSIALILTLLFAYQAQKIFTDPLLKLLKSMHHVTTEHQYNMKIEIHQQYDEFGELINGYNDMLTQLEQQHKLTTHYQLNLEKRVEERTLQLRKARDEALSASRLKSIFLANMSHEIRTPMNAILGYAQLLQQSELNEEQARKLGIIDKSGNHLLSLINDILELSKIEAGSLELAYSDFDLTELIQSVENMFKIRCSEKNISWKLDTFTQEPVLVNGDQGKLRQILINLLGNACKFTDQGEILFKIEEIATHRYKFSISDSGAGIEEEALSRIFDAFHQEKQGVLKGGTGLGLNITKRYVELISGHLNVSSKVGHGSIFYFDIELLPADESFTSTKTEASNTSYTVSTDQQISALIVEDNLENTELLSNILSPLGFDITCAVNGQEGLEKIEKMCPDIIFMDIRMPVMDGLEAIKKIRLKYSSDQLKCIAVTASTLQHSSQYYIDAGFDFFISKPFRFNDIYHAVKDILGLELKISENKKEPIETTIEKKTKLNLDQDFIEKLTQAAEYSQLTELKKLLVQLEKHGPAGEIVANHLELLINTADLDGIAEYVEGVINEQNHS
ncbi:MAG: ATP-binding protein [Gammaproteobacteria bacterium]|nr:ATP-binding protein [Gammaproteobacteria bacterium]